MQFGIIATIVIIFATQYAKVNNQEIVSVFYDFLSLPVVLCSMAIFVGIKQIFQKKELNEKGQKVIQKWTKLTLGVYLVHPLFIELMKPLHISILSGRIWITILFITIIIYLLSIGVTFVLSKIPKLGKYIV